MNAERHTDWACRLLAVLDMPEKGEVAGLLGPDEEGARSFLENKLGWLRDFRQEVARYKRLLDAVKQTEQEVKNHGLGRQTAAQVWGQLAPELRQAEPSRGRDGQLPGGRRADARAVLHVRGVVAEEPGDLDSVRDGKAPRPGDEDPRRGAARAATLRMRGGVNVRISGILETALYVSDPAATAAFYKRLFGFPTLLESERLVALDVAGRNVLLLFRQGATGGPFDTGGGVIPGHAGAAPTHFAFSIEAPDVEAWKAKLEAEGVKVESVVNWPKGAVSIYFRDPDGDLAELITRGFWAIY